MATTRWEHLVETLAGKTAEWVRRRHARASGRWLLGVAAAVFLGVTALAVSRLPALEFRPGWLALAVALSIPLVLVNAGEYWLAGRWLGLRIRPAEALRVSVLASAANLAPIPGAAIVRGQDLYSRGGRPAHVFRALAAVGIGWIAASLLAAAVAFAASGNLPLATAAVTAALASAGLVVPVAPAGGAGGGGLRRAGECLLLEALLVCFETARLLAVFEMVGLGASVAQVLGFPLAGAVASASGVFPGGLGLRELLAGGLAELVALPASSGVVATAADRVIGLSVLALITSVILVLRPGRGEGRAPAAGHDPDGVDDGR